MEVNVETGQMEKRKKRKRRRSEAGISCSAGGDRVEVLDAGSEATGGNLTESEPKKVEYILYLAS